MKWATSVGLKGSARSTIRKPPEKPGQIDLGGIHFLAELMRPESTGSPAPGAVHFTNVEGRKRLNVIEIGNVKHPHERMQRPRPVVVFLIYSDGNAPPVKMVSGSGRMVWVGSGNGG